MDLISSVTATDLIAGVSFSMIFGVVATAIAMNIEAVWQFWSANPVVQTFVNTTLVVLKNTELVWKPVMSTSLVVLKPILSFAVAVLKPFGPGALVVLDTVVRGMVLFGFMTTHVVFSVVKAFSSSLVYLQSVGINVTSAVQTLAYGVKDFATSLYTIVKAVSYIFLNVFSSVSFVIDSFEMFGLFLRRVLFEGHQVTWNDLSDIAVPFSVVGCIVGFVAWRAYSRFAKPTAPHKKFDDECVVPRRSSRLARKRALLLCSDMTLPRQEASLGPPNL